MEEGEEEQHLLEAGVDDGEDEGRDGGAVDEARRSPLEPPDGSTGLADPALGERMQLLAGGPEERERRLLTSHRRRRVKRDREGR